MYMNDILNNISGKNELKIKKENLSKLSMPELLSLAKEEQDGKIKIAITDSPEKAFYEDLRMEQQEQM